MGGGKTLIFSIKNTILHPYTPLSYLFWFRLAQSSQRFKKTTARICGYIGKRCQVYIPVSTKIGYGLYLGHFTCIVVNGGTRIGNNCNLSHYVSIGSNHNTPAIIGDNVYIGPNVSIVENVHIGDNVTIGAGSVVTKDIPSDATAVGVPAKVINFKSPARYIGNKYNSI